MNPSKAARAVEKLAGLDIGLTPEEMHQKGLKASCGTDGELDYVEAHKWFNLASLLGHKPSQAYRTELAEEMSQIEMAKAQRAARKWLIRHVPDFFAPKGEESQDEAVAAAA